MEKDTDTRSRLLNIDIRRIEEETGEKTSQTITSRDSASLPASELVPEITIRDEEHGISIEYVEGSRTREAVELLFKRLTQKSMPLETPLPDSQLQRITIQALRQAPLKENEFVLSWQEETEAYLFFFPDKLFVKEHFKETCIQRVTPQEADILVTQQLDKTNINSLKTISMGTEGQPISHTEEATKTVAEQRAELAQRFTYEDVSKIPPGVDPKQLDFLHDAVSVGGFEWVRGHTAEMIADYYTTEATLADLAKQYGISAPAVRERITRGMSKMRRILYRDKPELAEGDTYPLEQIQKGKERIEVLKSEQSRRRVGEASRSTLKRPGVDIFTTKKDLH